MANIDEDLYLSISKDFVPIAPFDLNDRKYVIYIQKQSSSNDGLVLYGLVRSNIYQGKFKHKISIDGNPISGLGYPKGMFNNSNDIVVIKGSDEEKSYLDMIEKYNLAQKQYISRAKEIIVGTWSFDNNSGGKYIQTFYPNGKMHTKYIRFDDDEEHIADWYIDSNNELNYKILYIKYFRSNNWNSRLHDTYVNKLKIEYMDENRFRVDRNKGTRVTDPSIIKQAAGNLKSSEVNFGDN